MKKNKLEFNVSIPLSGQYVCNELKQKKGDKMTKSQSPYRVNMFVTTGLRPCIQNVQMSQSPYRVNMFVTKIPYKSTDSSCNCVSIPLSGQYVCNAPLKTSWTTIAGSQSPYRVNMFVTIY